MQTKLNPLKLKHGLGAIYAIRSEYISANSTTHGGRTGQNLERIFVHTSCL